jgi:hypothetical protein
MKEVAMTNCQIHAGIRPCTRSFTIALRRASFEQSSGFWPRLCRQDATLAGLVSAEGPQTPCWLNAAKTIEIEEIEARASELNTAAEAAKPARR